MNPLEIAKGFMNLAFDNLDILDENIKQEGLRRSSKCASCPLRTNNKCDTNKEGAVVIDFVYYDRPLKKGDKMRGCGCYIPAKILNPNSQCPLGKFEKDN